MEDESETSAIRKDWEKLERVAKKNGLRDGISEGRDSNFQKSFDEGFAAGFQSGFIAGKFKGLIFASSQHSNTSTEENPLLNKPERGWCQICLDNNLLNEAIPKIASKQSEVFKNNSSQLQTTYNFGNLE